MHIWSKKLVKDFEGRHDFVHLEGARAAQEHFCGLLSKGYADIVLIMREGGLSQPLQDDLASLFLEPAFAVSRGLLNGKKPSEAVELAKESYKRSIREALNSDVQTDQEKCVPWLLHDLLHIKAFGE